MGKIIKTYFFSNNIAILLIIEADSITLLYYNDQYYEVKKINSFSFKNNIVEFNGNIFSSSLIYYNDIKLKFNDLLKFDNKTILKKCNGTIDGNLYNIKMYYSEELYKNSPYKYNKIIFFDKEENVFSFTDFYDKKNNIKLLTNINNIIIKDNDFITYKEKNNSKLIKTYQHIYNLTYNTIEHYSDGETNFILEKISFNILIKKAFKEAFIENKYIAFLIKYKY